MPTITDAPPSNAGRRGKTLDAKVVKEYADALAKVGEGQVVATDETYDDKSKARKAVELVRRELVRAKAVESRAHLGTRIWPEGDKFRAGVMPRTPDAADAASNGASA